MMNNNTETIRSENLPPIPQINREKGLGMLSLLPDDVFTYGILLPFLNGCEVARSLTTVSKAMLVISEAPDLWRRLLLEKWKKYGLQTEFHFLNNWKQTFVYYYCLKELNNRYLFEKFQNFGKQLYLRWDLVQKTQMKQLVYPDTGEIDRIDATKWSVEQFTETYVKTQRPVIITNALHDWKAFNEWNKDDGKLLLERYGDVAFRTDAADYVMKEEPSDEVQQTPTPSEEEKKKKKRDKAVKMRLRDFLQYMKDNQDEDPIYTFDYKFVERTRGRMLEEYSVPKFFPEDLFEKYLSLSQRPHFRWIVIGCARSGSGWHMDPHKTSAWNALVKGTKRWAFYPMNMLPDLIKEEIEGEDVENLYNLPLDEPLEWFTEDYYEICQAGQKPWECTQFEGDLLYVPSTWWHIVLNIEDTISITPNFCDRYNFLHVMKDLYKTDLKFFELMKEKVMQDEELKQQMLYFEQSVQPTLQKSA